MCVCVYANLNGARTKAPVTYLDGYDVRAFSPRHYKICCFTDIPFSRADNHRFSGDDFYVRPLARYRINNN